MYISAASFRHKEMLKVKQYGDVTRLTLGTEIKGRVVFSVCAYLIDGLLIDTGPHNTRYELVDFVREQKVSVAVNTHHHVDHVGGNRVISEELKIPIFASLECALIICNRQNIFPYQRELWGEPQPCQVSVLGEKVETEHFGFQVIKTGAHSEDHVVFLLKEKGWLFTGDEFLTENPNSARKGEDNEKMVQALKRMLDLSPEVLFTSSGRIYWDGSGSLRRAIAYYERIKEEVCKLNMAGFNSQEIVIRLFGSETPLKEYTDGRFSRQNFVEGFNCNN